jgi:hypothetical protein
MRKRTGSSSLSRRLVAAVVVGIAFETALFGPTSAPADAKAKEKAVEDLLKRKASEKGPVFPGKDPAFLVLPRATERSRMAEELLTDEVKEMIDGALKYLVTMQDADGGWTDKDFQSNTGVAALAMMAFMSEGSRPNIGRYGRQITRGIEFLTRNVQTSSGILVGKTANELGPMYEHLLATLVLLMNFGDMPWEPGLRPIITRALEGMQQAQKRDGGWRYSYSPDGASDISVTGNALWVLRTAKKSGFTVSADVVRKGMAYVERCALPDGTFRYRHFGLTANPSMSGTGIIALVNDGSLDHMLIPPTRDRIAYDYQRYTVQDFLDREYFVYGIFFGSLAMYTTGDTYYLPYYKKAVEILRAARRKDGEFADHRGNTVYVTAMAAIALQAPYGYLPIYER